MQMKWSFLGLYNKTLKNCHVNNYFFLSYNLNGWFKKLVYVMELPSITYLMKYQWILSQENLCAKPLKIVNIK